MESSMMDIGELSVYLKIKKKTIYDLVYRKRIPYTKVGNQLRFPIALIDQWLKGRTYVPFGAEICYNSREVEGEGA